MENKLLILTRGSPSTIRGRNKLDAAINSGQVAAAVLCSVWGGGDVCIKNSIYELFENIVDCNEGLLYWNVSNVTNINYMFFGCTSFNQDLSGWNVSSVTEYLNFYTESGLSNEQVPLQFRTSQFLFVWIYLKIKIIKIYNNNN